MPVGFTSQCSVQVLGFASYWPAHPTAPPLSVSCSSGPRFAYGFLQIPPHDGHPCCSANDSPCRVRRGLSPPSECALPGAPNKKSGLRTKAPDWQNLPYLFVILLLLHRTQAT